jgi:hypothetical protein
VGAYNSPTLNEERGLLDRDISEYSDEVSAGDSSAIVDFPVPAKRAT